MNHRPPPGADRLLACWSSPLKWLCLIGIVGAVHVSGACPAAQIDAGTYLGFPPITLTGSVGYTAQTQQIGETPREYRNRVNGTVDGSSYVWHPWFTTVDGTVTLTQDVTNGGSAETDSLVFTGAGNLNVLPLSNFPTTFSYLHTDSSVDGTLFISQTTTDRASVRNRVYLPDWQLSIATSGMIENTERTGTGEEDVLQGTIDVTKGFEESTINLSMKHDQSVFTPSDGGDQHDRLTDLVNLRHDYEPFDNIYVQSSSTALRSEESFESTDRNTFLLQGVTSGQWRPVATPLTVNGALRTLTQSIDLTAASGGTNTTDTQSFAGTIGMNYLIAPRFTANSGLNANVQSVETEAAAESGEVLSGDAEHRNATASAGVNYYSLDRDIMGFDWSWNTASQGQAGYASAGEGTRSVSASLGHTARRSLEIPFLGLSLFSASQQGAAAYSMSGGAVPSVSHNASLTRSFAANRVRTYIRLSGSDQRELGGDDPTSFQLLTAQVNRVETIDGSSNWQASLSLQASRQTFGDEDSGFNTTSHGSASYNKRDLFDVSDLRFRSEVIVAATGFGQNVESERLSEQIDSQWINQLDYRIGKITMRFQTRVFRNNGELGNIAYFSILRHFD